MQVDLQFAVERLHARYAQALDSDNLEAWPDFFTENGRYRIATAENEARGLPLPVLSAEGRGMMRDRIQSLRHANIYEPSVIGTWFRPFWWKKLPSGKQGPRRTSSLSASCRTGAP